MHATLTTHGGRPALRLQRRLPHPPERVLRGLTDPEDLGQWYPFPPTEMDLRPGGTLVFDDGQGGTTEAIVTAYDPPRVFAFRESESLVRFDLRPADGGCLLDLTHIFADRPAAASYATGWTGCLEMLERVLAGRRVEWPGPRPELHDSYVRAFGLDAGTAEDTASGGWRVRFERQLTQPVDTVWQALCGGTVPATGAPPPRTSTVPEFPPGPVTALARPRLLEYAWRAPGQAEHPPAGHVRWELSPGTGHGARLLLTQTGPPELSAERDTALARWRSALWHLAAPLPPQE